MRCLCGLSGLLLGLRASTVLAATCTFQPFTTVPGADVDIRWAAKSGHPCTLVLTVDSHIEVQRMLVVQQAAHGTAATPTLSSISYRSRPGFVGRDSFVIERTAEGMARRVIGGTAHWTVNVDVVP